MKKVLLIILLMLPAIANAQNMVARPIDEAGNDPSFLAYRTALIQSVKSRDTEAVVAASANDIHLSFGGHSGHNDLRDFLNVPIENLADEYKTEAPKMRDERWGALLKVLELGGRFQEGAFTAPYTWTAEVPEQSEAYETFFVTGSNVLLRTAGKQSAPIKSRLSYNIVYIPEWAEDEAYQNISLPDGTSGFLSVDYLRAQIDYRSIFAKQNGVWEMTVFIAGD